MEPVLPNISRLKAMTVFHAMRLLAVTLNQPVVFISFDYEQDVRETIKIAPLLNHNEEFQRILFDGEGVIICETLEDMHALIDSSRHVTQHNPAFIYMYGFDATGANTYKNH